MARLVEQIQLDAVSSTVPVAQLLRRVKLAAVKLQLPDVADWVESELAGYTSRVPDYRIVYGQPQVLNPYRGWIPVGGDPTSVRSLSRRAVLQDISSLEALAKSPGEGTVFFSFPPEVLNTLSRSQGINWPQGGVHIDVSTIVGVIERVRSRVLDWALDLERAGIMGDEMSFTPEEKQRASSMSVSIKHFSGQLHQGLASGDGSQIVQSSSSPNPRDARVFDDLRALVADNVRDVSERNRLFSGIAALERDAGTSLYSSRYRDFISMAANHMTLLAPLLPALSALLS